VRAYKHNELRPQNTLAQLYSAVGVKHPQWYLSGQTILSNA